MPLHTVAYFFGGVFSANALSHLVSGVTGRRFPTPFATPPFRGLSSPAVNVGWGMFNVCVAYLLLLQVGVIDVRSFSHAVAALSGFGAMALQCARATTRIFGSLSPSDSGRGDSK
jgi:hypothetical protein